MSNVRTNEALYQKVIRDAKRKFKVWPSAYASGWVVKEYKRRGGFYKTRSRSKKVNRKSKRNSGLSRWFSEKWVDVCKLPKIVPCGRKRSNNAVRKYPYCRPLYRVSSKSPRTARSLSRREINRRCRSKRRDPKKRVY
jgi:hypothetical protein